MTEPSKRKRRPRKPRPVAVRAYDAQPLGAEWCVFLKAGAISVYLGADEARELGEALCALAGVGLANVAPPPVDAPPPPAPKPRPAAQLALVADDEGSHGR